VQNNCTVTGLALNTELDFLINSKKINKDIDLHYFDIDLGLENTINWYRKFVADI